MAIMYPDGVDPGAPRSEQRVYESFQGAVPDEFIILHSKRFLIPAFEDNNPLQGEVDFIILDPKRGYLCLEVKGGGVRRAGDKWQSRDRNGNVHDIKDPGKQAQSASFRIRDFLRETPWFSANGIIPRHCWGVAFPDLEIDGSLGPELPRDLIMDRQDLADPFTAIRRMFESFNIRHSPISAKAQSEFMKALAPEFELLPSLAGQIDDEKASLIRLTEEQMAILEVIGESKRVGVKGTAGSGKTLVAMELSRRLAEQGQRVLFLCYNKFLADFLSRSAEGFVIKGFHKLCADISKAAGIHFNPPNDPSESQEFWATTAPELLMDALDMLPDERWDTIIVDEGQDFKELWWIAVERLMKDPENDRLWVFYDPHQDIYGGGPTEAMGLQPGSLTYNCRNTTKIAGYSSDLIGIHAKLRPNAPEGSDLIELTCATDREMVNGVRKVLHSVINEGGVEAKNVIILSPKNVKRSAVWREKKFGNFELVEYPQLPGPNQIQLATLQSFKGLEADVAILCEVADGEPNTTSKHLYVGTSRARHLLAVLKYADTDQ
jgi:hypothetical protein